MKDIPIPKILKPTDAIVKVTKTTICGIISDFSYANFNLKLLNMLYQKDSKTGRKSNK